MPSGNISMKMLVSRCEWKKPPATLVMKGHSTNSWKHSSMANHAQESPLHFHQRKLCWLMNWPVTLKRFWLRSHWNLTSLAQEAVHQGVVPSIFPRNVCRFLKFGNIEPRKNRYWLNSPEKHDEPETFKKIDYMQVLPWSICIDRVRHRSIFYGWNARGPGPGTEIPG